MQKIEIPKIYPCTYIQLIYNEGGKNIQLEKKTISSISGAGKKWTATCKRMRLEYSLTSCT